MFVGRESELTKLEKMYSTNEFQFAVIYGRRRVGKTTLIREFLKGLTSNLVTLLLFFFLSLTRITTRFSNPLSE